MELYRPPVQNRARSSAARVFASRAVPLTPRRGQVLVLYLSGQQRKQIARGLGVSSHTVRNHIRNVYEQLGFSNRVEALRWALEQPTLAEQIFKLSGFAVEQDGTEGPRGTRANPTSFEDAVGEAIGFFRREVIESSLETA